MEAFAQNKPNSLLQVPPRVLFFLEKYLGSKKKTFLPFSICRLRPLKSLGVAWSSVAENG